jgi:DNA invertase Pin-like site-specific DNA recombinase
MVRNAAPNPKLVAYERVSTARQGKSGLGLAAQRKAIDDYAAAKGGTILARFTEVESGRGRTTGRNSKRRCSWRGSPVRRWSSPSSTG